ncbi:MAG: DNA polymerase III subunit delta [Alphaproteobacteria bacterium]|nr:DNA polymerase III subunit delta [Alphaproteobacteria bacterium]
MTAIKAAGLDAFLRRPDPEVGLLLIYGDDPVAVHDLASKAVQRVAGSLDDPFAVARLDEADLSGDPARLVDEIQAISMLGGTRAIWVRGAGDGFLKAATPVLDGQVRGNFIVAEAAGLPRTSGLRKALETSPRAIILPLYEAEDGDISTTIERGLAQSGLAIDTEAKFRLMELAGSSRGLVQREVEKLGLYAMGQDRVSLADVEAICGNGADPDPDDLADAAFSGDLEAVDRLFNILVQGGVDAGRLVSAAHIHALRLQDFRLAIDAGGRAEQLLRGARPPIFFKRHRVLQTQLRLWTTTALLQAATTLGAAVAQVRLNALLGSSIASRALLAIARNTRALQADRL